MPDNTKKISELTSITAAGISSGDLFAVTDISNSTSSKITFGNVTDAVLSDANIESKATNIITKLNAVNSSTPSLSNSLNAGGLYYNGSYRDGTYFLEYANFNNTPTIPTDLTGFANSGNFISFDTVQNKILVTGTGSTSITPNTDHLEEGISNLYYTDTRADSRVTAKFAGLFNQFSDTFDGGVVIDSLVDVSGVFQGVVNDLSSVIRVSDATLSNNFSVGQNLRIYGASDSTTAIVGNPTPTLTVQGQAGFSEDLAGNTANNKTLAYKFAYFDLKDGRIGALGSASTKVIRYTADGGSTYTDPLPRFNTDNFIKFTGMTAGTNQGIVVYRSIDGGTFKLLAVLGPKNFDGGLWQDYHLFDYTSWGGKNSTDNTYSAITHFPLTEHSVAQRGWMDVSIKSIDVRSSYFDITLGDSATDTTTQVYCNASPHAVQIAHNDTSKINESIQSRSSSGNKSITLNGKTYVASHLSVPDNFGIVGTANITKIKKLPWSQMNGDNQDNSLIKSQTITNSTTISIYGVDFDGSLTSQCLVNDGTDKSLNYILDFGTSPNDLLLDRCRVLNVIGGGIYANSPKNLRISTSEIRNSGVSDVNVFSPLYASDGLSTIVTSSRFENYTDSVDLSVTTEGMAANNIVKACGSGLLIAGSTFMVSSPNVLIGAANEFLSSPDILNTEYDSINIPLDRFIDAGDYTSSSHAYQENGEAFDLTKTSISTVDGELVYRLNLIQQLSNGSTLPYAVDAGPNVVDIQTGPLMSFVSGNVNTGTNRITITDHTIPNGSRIRLATGSNALGSSTDGDYFAKVIGNEVELYDSYTAPSTFASQQGLSSQGSGTLQIVPAPSIPLVLNKRYIIKNVGTSMNWTSIGAKIGMVGEYFKYNGTAVTGTNGIVSAEDFVGLNNQVSPIITDVSKTPEEKALGQFQFKLTDINKALLYTGAFSPSQLQQKYDAKVGTAGYPTGSKHLGVAWSASYRYFASVGTIASGEWYVYKAGASPTTVTGGITLNDTSLKNSPQYRMVVNNPINITQGMEIELNAHSGFIISGGNVSGNPIYAQITDIQTITGQPTKKNVFLTFYNLLGDASSPAADGDGEAALAAGNLVKGTNGTGTINTVDDFVIAQGLIK